MATMNASKFKEQCLFLIYHLDEDGIVITKHGKPVAKVIPIKSGCAHLIGALRGKIRIHGDVFSTGLDWDAGEGIVDGAKRRSKKTGC
ncbi:MAG: type II toxin-antitoxin system prevent-host-death family antitoxin [Bryobacteraceae bacterium]